MGGAKLKSCCSLGSFWVQETCCHVMFPYCWCTGKHVAKRHVSWCWCLLIHVPRRGRSWTEVMLQFGWFLGVGNLLPRCVPVLLMHRQSCWYANCLVMLMCAWHTLKQQVYELLMLMSSLVIYGWSSKFFFLYCWCKNIVSLFLLICFVMYTSEWKKIVSCTVHGMLKGDISSFAGYLKCIYWYVGVSQYHPAAALSSELVHWRSSHCVGVVEFPILIRNYFVYITFMVTWGYAYMTEEYEYFR